MAERESAKLGSSGMAYHLLSLFESEDLFKRCLDECCEQSAVLFEAPKKLFNSFKAISEASNDIVGAYVEFRLRLEGSGFTSGNSKANNVRYWQGLSLKKWGPVRDLFDLQRLQLFSLYRRYTRACIYVDKGRRVAGVEFY